MQLFVRSLEGRTVVVQLGPRPCLGELVEALRSHGSAHCCLLAGGRLVQGSPDCELTALGLDPSCTLQLAGRLLGGKGGFGSNLRAAGKSRLTDNFDACRDLQGRRVRLVTAAAKLEEWKAQAAERQLERVAHQHLRRLAKEERAREREEVDVVAVRSATRSALAGGEAEVEAALRVGRGMGSGQGPAPGPAPAKRQRMDPLADLSDDSDSEAEAGVAEDRAGTDASSGSAELDVFRPRSAEASGANAMTAQQDVESAAVRLDGAAVGPDGDEEAASREEEAAGAVPESTGDDNLPGQGPVDKTPAEPNVAEKEQELDWGSITSATELETLGLDGLKRELGQRGLKVGGTLAQRAQRLFNARPALDQ